MVRDLDTRTRATPASAALTGPGRQRPLTAIPCHCASDRRLRPHCDGITATVQYGRLALCASCDARRSTVGKGQIGRRLDAPDPNEELRAVAHAQRQVREAERPTTLRCESHATYR
jgi:hypothetical protein